MTRLVRWGRTGIEHHRQQKNMFVLGDLCGVFVKKLAQGTDVVGLDAASFSEPGLDFCIEQRLLFWTTLIGSCHRRASTSCWAITAIDFSLEPPDETDKRLIMRDDSSENRHERQKSRPR